MQGDLGPLHRYTQFHLRRRRPPVMPPSNRAPSLFVISVLTLASCGGGSDAAAPLPGPVPVPATAPAPAPVGRTIDATPSDYLSKVRALTAGDTLVLAAGTYDDPTDAPGL